MKNKKNWIYLAAFGGILLLCLGLLLWQSTRPKAVAEIYKDGQLLQRVRFADLKEPMKIPIGKGNIACADGEGIWMEHADCPDQLCVKQGKIKSGNLSIVCLPNGVTITLQGESGWDGVSQ